MGGHYGLLTGVAASKRTHTAPTPAATKQTGIQRRRSHVSPLYDEAVIRTMFAVVAGLLLASCGGGDLSLAEYNTEGLALGAAMEERIYVLDVEWDSQTATVEDVWIHAGRDGSMSWLMRCSDRTADTRSSSTASVWSSSDANPPSEPPRPS